MRILKSIVIAFSMYSRIPMPRFQWKDEDMRYMLCFFPWVGGVIGVCVYLWAFICDCFGIGTICHTLVGAFIPLAVTGGFHVDGFMDTMDAFHSYRTREKKLEILKDSHIGAFSVIMLAAYGLLYLGAFSEIHDRGILRTVCAGFALSRCLSGIGVVTFRSARSDGLLYLFASSAAKRRVRFFLYLQGAVCIGYMLVSSLYAGLAVTAMALAAFTYYYWRCKKELGGITGDTAGYFVLICEVSMVVTAAITDAALR